MDMKWIADVHDSIWTAADGTPLGGFAYTYDAAGSITARRHALGTNRFDRAYAYDGLDRLAADGPVSYAWDAAGNRAAKRGGSEGDVAYALGAGDRLASWTGGAYAYDAAGNVTRIVRDGRPTLDLAWNGQYQLVSVSTNGVLAESYAYDALGRRASTTTREGTVRHVYGRRWQVLADLDGAGRVLRSYTWGGGVDNLLAARVGARAYAALTDAQGTVWGLVGAGGEVAARWTYDAWGNVLSEEAADPALASFRYRFQGRELSAATGLVHFRARWYDPGTGRWLSKDPVRIMGGLNLYEFCLGNPVSDVDPFGLSAGEKARDWARKQKGKTKYNVWGTRGFPRWWGRFKCNLFVADAYNEGNGTELIPTGIWGTHPPSANDWYEGNNIPPGFVKTKDAQVGDVISDGSHVGIVADPGTSSISASSIDNAVIENDWGFRSGQDVSFWHLE